jgi:hypothetical protein
VNFKAAGPITPPDCYQFDIKVRNWQWVHTKLCVVYK